MQRLCMIFEKTENCKANEIKGFKTDGSRDLKTCALRFHDNFLIDTR